MRTQTDNDWQEHRQTPLLLWGMGETGQAAASYFVEKLAKDICAKTSRQVQLFQALQDPVVEFREQVRQQLENAQTHRKAPDFEVALLIAAWQFDAAQQSELISRLDQILTGALPEKKSLTLILLLPSLNADTAKQHSLRRCFLELNKLSVKLSSLNLILLCPIPALDRDILTLFEPLFEILSQSLLDTELTAILRRSSQDISRRMVNRQPAVYCALGMQRLLSQTAALLEQLEARFQNALFWRGLVNLNHLSPSQRSTLQARTQAFLHDCTRAFAEQYNIFPEAVANLPSNPLGTTAIGQASAVFQAEFDAAEQQIKARLSPFLNDLEQGLREEFATVLATGPAYLASSRFYLEALTAGLQASQEEFCRKPLQATVTAYYEARLEKLTSPFHLPLAQAGQESVATVRNAIQALHIAIDSSTAEQHIPSRFLALSWDKINAYLEQDAPGVADARQLLSSTFSLFLTEALPLAGRLQDLQRRQEALGETGAAPAPKQSWHKRLLQWPTTGQDNQAVQTRLAELKKERTQWQGLYAAMYRFYLGLISEILWPQVVRLLIVEGFRSRLRALVLEFTSFWATAGAACAERWRDAEYLPTAAAGTAVPMITRDQLDALYENTIGQSTWPEQAAQALAFLPGTSVGTPSYEHCQNLHDHFQAGSDSLLERLSAFAAARFTDLRTHDALDLLELAGIEPAKEMLSRALLQAQSWPVFAPIRLAQLKRQDLPRRITVIRCTPRLREALQSRYRELFDAESFFLDSADTQCIELTVLTIGFPAFLLDMLQDIPNAGK
jgi:hypothetical protein